MLYYFFQAPSVTKDNKKGAQKSKGNSSSEMAAKMLTYCTVQRFSLFLVALLSQKCCTAYL